MKHLRHIFESDDFKNEEILQNLEDICLELQDDRYTINISDEDSIFNGRYSSLLSTDLSTRRSHKMKEKYIDAYFIQIKKYKCQDNLIHTSQQFNYSDVDEYIERMKDYMELEGFKIMVEVPDPNNSWQMMTLKEYFNAIKNSTEDHWFSEIRISFYKLY
jgi:hypothetical protein